MGSNPPNNQIAGALTYPASSSSNVQRLPAQPRQPRSLQGLLRFAMEATKAEDAPGNSELGPMDEERRRFLEEALKSLTVNVAEVLQRAIKVLTDREKVDSVQFGEGLPEDVANSFDNLSEYIDDLDVANDFYKMGGFAIFPICYSSENEELRTRASAVLAELCQNNPFCQAKALECGLLDVLLHLVQSERGQALIKCLYAISCTCREFEPACHDLIEKGGCDVLAELLTAHEEAARTKAAFLIRYLSHHYPEAKDRFIQNNLVGTITDQVKCGRDSTTEHLLSILHTLIEGSDPRILRQCRDPAIDLKNVLENHLKSKDLQDDTYLEEKEYCQQLLRAVFENCPVEDLDEEIADR